MSIPSGVLGTGDRARQPARPDGQKASLLGPCFSDDDVGRMLAGLGARSRALGPDELAEEVARLIDDEQVVGLFQGAMEFGPRALGCRSILGDARSPRMQSQMNLKIKFRESFRPFAPIVRRARAREFFDLPEGVDSPYMLLVAQVAEGQRRKENGAPKAGFEKLAVVRSTVPAVTHVDGSARVQTVDPERHPRLDSILAAFESRMPSNFVTTASALLRAASRSSWAWIALSIAATSFVLLLGTSFSTLRYQWTIQRCHSASG